MKHIPVLLKEVIEILNPQPNEFFIDGTIGSGGHAAEIFKRISPGGTLLGIDWDENAIKIAEQKISANSKFQTPNSKLILVHGNYADLPEILKKHKLPKADGLILDLGFSSESLESGRGFTFQKNEPLDMRYNANSQTPMTNDQNITAAEVINSFSEKDLADIFWKYGEERYSRQIAKKIITERKKKRIRTTFDLVEIIGGGNARIHPPHKFMWGIHPATRVFQALRIYVNDELGNLEKTLKNIGKIVKSGSENSIGSLKANKIDKYRVSTTGKGRVPHINLCGGRVAIISFHSLEDRLVKNWFKDLKNQGKAQILTNPAGKPLVSHGAGKPIRPTFEEIRTNPRSRSAKLRACSII